MTHHFDPRDSTNPTSVEQHLVLDGYVEGHHLASLLENQGFENLPASVKKHICDHLRGEARRRPGPKRRDADYEHALSAAACMFHLAMDLLRPFNREAWPFVFDPQTVEGAPGKKAMAFVRSQFPVFKPIQDARLRNLICERHLALKAYDHPDNRPQGRSEA